LTAKLTCQVLVRADLYLNIPTLPAHSLWMGSQGQHLMFYSITK
jgi:hypothetical protein